jgi:glycosyltransferase involved in cell wall biosynthesis
MTEVCLGRSGETLLLEPAKKQERCGRMIAQPLSVVIPAYNEERTLQNVIERVLRIPHLHEVIVVDDGSSDGTSQVISLLQSKYSQLRSVRHEKNKGKTEALKTGFKMTTGEIVVVQDADLEYDPDEIAEVISPILQGKADVVYGSRFLVRRAARVVYFYHYLGNRILTFFSNLFTNLNMSDVETCYKAFRGDIIRSMVIDSEGFGFEVEVTAKIAKLKCPVYEVPISYYGRTYEEGKKIGARDGLAALWYICKYNMLVSTKRSFNPLTRPEQKQLSEEASHP